MRNPPNETLGVATAQALQPLPSSRAKSRSAGADGGDTPLDFARDERDEGAKHVPERTCILSRRAAPRDELIRLALGPDGQVAPDVRAKAPGRGAWIGVDRATLDAAQAKGKLKGALGRAFKSQAVSAPEDLGERIEAALRQAVIGRLGLEARASNLVVGGEKIETALRRGQVRLLIHADDAGADGTGKLDQALRVGSDGAQRRGLVFPAGRAILSLALGRQNVVHVAIVDRAAAARVQGLIDRWAAFIGRDAALGAADATPGASA